MFTVIQRLNGTAANNQYIWANRLLWLNDEWVAPIGLHLLGVRIGAPYLLCFHPFYGWHLSDGPSRIAAAAVAARGRAGSRRSLK